MQDHAADPGGLHPLDGLARPPGRAGVGGAAGAAGAGRRGLRRRAGRDRRGGPVRGRGRRHGRHHRGAARPGHGRRHPGGQGGHPRGRPTSRGEQGRPRGRRPHGARPAARGRAGAGLRARRWRVPVVRTVATEGTGSTTSSQRSRRTGPRSATTGCATGGCAGPRREVEGLAVEALRARVGGLHGDSRLDALADDVVAGRTDPYAAADRLVDELTSGGPPVRARARAVRDRLGRMAAPPARARPDLREPARVLPRRPRGDGTGARTPRCAAHGSVESTAEVRAQPVADPHDQYATSRRPGRAGSSDSRTPRRLARRRCSQSARQCRGRGGETEAVTMATAYGIKVLGLRIR